MTGTPGTGPHDDPDRQARTITRKTLLKGVLAAAPVPFLIGGGTALARTLTGNGRNLSATPACGDGDDELTPPEIEGPYFKPSSPRRTNLREPGMAGTPLTVSGYVFGTTCQALPNVLLDFWQADDQGHYDMTGYTLRGHQYTDATGAFTLSTIVPGLYPGRTRHIHVKAQAPHHPILTTQLYFPGEPRNSTDAYFDPRLLMNVRTEGGGEEGTFDFVLDVTGGGPTSPPPTSPPPSGTWRAGTAYQVGDTVTYQGVTYRCRQAHTPQAGWEPPNTPALWQAV